jgi:hypothetical protein
MNICIKGTTDWHKQSRNLACSWCWAIGKLSCWRGRDLALYLLLGEFDVLDTHIANRYKRRRARVICAGSFNQLFLWHLGTSYKP